MERKLHVLFVDDEADFLEPIALWVKSKGYHVTTASRGKQAIELIQRDPPDIVFLDVQMPELDGLETLRRIRAFNSEIPVVIVTAAYQDETTFADAKTLGISGFFPKQESLDKLGELLEVTLRMHGKLKSPKEEDRGDPEPS